ncbi:MAG: AEC family transporter [Alphaproteobacteria bacterium]|nr:AEC family transporter [Alphaproteobacteria bacterium]MBU0795819.1 AEC family transporter [Alphaproteobacteria bacterium]MBU0886681.1 AEC family transporter [Alphaproteobacteria bacterium]MBU1814536.1 AEC family transporter [Alphaproteobacteria bacterium]
MSSVLPAIGPIFLMILLGTLLKRGVLFPRLGLGDGFWDSTERLTYYVLFPAMLLSRVAGSSVGELQILPMAAALIVPLLMMIGALLLMRDRLRMDMPALTSVMQGTIRPNVYVILAAGGALYGAAGNTLVAIAIGIVVPTVNVLCVILLARLIGTTEPGSRSIAKALITNPIIVAVVLGLVLSSLQVGLPPIIGPTLDTIGRAALPVGLLCVGAGLNFAAARAGRRGIIISSVLKLLVLPVLTAFACFVFGVEGLTAKIAILFSGAPAAASSYILARQMGGDHQLMAGILTTQVIAAALTLPVVITFLL